jgi:nucleoid DNA-binding protein
MMPFTQRLQFLLEKYDALILHGFGAFYARYQTAQWHPVTHRIIPPQKEISFNRSIQQTDGVLENEFKSSFELTSEESHALVKGMVDFLLEELEQQKNLVFEGVGELVVRPDGSWRFLPFEENQILPESFGLSPIQVRPVLRVASPTPSIETPLAETTDNSTSPKKFPWRAAAATFLLLALAGSIFWMNPFEKGNGDEHHTAQLLQTEPSSSFDSLKKDAEPQQDSSTETVTPKVESLPTASVQMPEMGYYIIVGSTTSEQEALELSQKNQWLALNFSDLGRFRLATQKFETRSEADAALSQVREAVEPKAWILKH